MEELTRTVPPWTLGYIVAAIALGATTTMGLISPYAYYLFFPKLLSGQIWRLFTPFLYAGNFSMRFFTHILFSYAF